MNIMPVSQTNYKNNSPNFKAIIHRGFPSTTKNVLRGLMANFTPHGQDEFFELLQPNGRLGQQLLGLGERRGKIAFNMSEQGQFTGIYTVPGQAPRLCVLNPGDWQRSPKATARALLKLAENAISGQRNILTLRMKKSPAALTQQPPNAINRADDLADSLLDAYSRV